MPDSHILRAYSIISPPEADYLEFLSIAVPDGPLTSQLVKIKEGDYLRVSTKPKGTLVLSNLDIIEPVEEEKRRLWMISTGTGLAPFLSIVRDNVTMNKEYDLFDDVIITHTCRANNELVFKKEIEDTGAKLYQTVTQEEPINGVFSGRVTDHIISGEIFKRIGTESGFDPRFDRVLICGNPSMNLQMVDILEQEGFVHGTASSPGTYCKEKAFFEGFQK